MSVTVQSPPSIQDPMSAAERIAIEPQILAGAKSMIASVTKSAQGMGGTLAWPVALHKLDRLDPGHKR
ncbi:hypothetical protein PS862_05484 [Pseudomonas fluorescens]|uniref:Uncharacterized protein n=1 Tax=Pseudomonas fluorescens TaxID=294 RepID=A0A5E7PU03_PSEFL|nr:hypothetical protein PS862_05484 [Pseudomonas fluorescens]